MRTTYRVPFPHVGLVALLAALVLLAVPGVSSAGIASTGSAAAIEAGREPLARGAGYDLDRETAARVRALQRTLRRLDWRPGPIDGLFGPLTEAAVVRFQRATRLAADGIVGPRTGRALRTTERRWFAERAQRTRNRARRAAPERVRTALTRLLRVGVRPEAIAGASAQRSPSTETGLRTPAAVYRQAAADRSGEPRPPVVPLLIAAALLGMVLAAAPIAARFAGPARSNARKGPTESGREHTPENAAFAAPTGRVHAGVGMPVGGVARPGHGTEQPENGRDRTATTARSATVSSRTEGDEVDMAGIGPASTVKAGNTPPRTGDAAMFEGAAGAARRTSGVASAADRGDRPTNGADRPVGLGDVRGAGVAPRVNGGERATNGSQRPGHDGETPPGGVPAKPLRVLGYVSIPEAEQLDRELLNRQTAGIHRLCDMRGWTLVELVRDVEGAKVKGRYRPGLRYALEMIANGEVSCLVVSQLRRLSRSAADLGSILQTIAGSGGRLVALDMEIDTATAEGRKAANLLISTSAWERERVGQQTRAGLEAVRARGGQISRPAVEDIPGLKEWIARMRTRGLTLQAIADRLNEERVPTLRGGKEWRPSSVQAAAGYRRPQRRWSGQSRERGARVRDGDERGGPR